MISLLILSPASLSPSTCSLGPVLPPQHHSLSETYSDHFVLHSLYPYLQHNWLSYPHLLFFIYLSSSKVQFHWWWSFCFHWNINLMKTEISQHKEYCLAQSSCPITMCWMNKHICGLKTENFCFKMFFEKIVERQWPLKQVKWGTVPF